MLRKLFSVLFLLSAAISNAQVKSSQDIIAIFESGTSVEKVLEDLKFKYHTTTSTVRIYKGSYQDVYITYDNSLIKEVLVRNRAGYNMKSVEKSLSSDWKLTLKDKRRRVYTGTNYQLTFITNDSKYEVSLALR